MRRLSRAPKVLGIPIRPKTAIDLAKAARDITTKRFVPDEIKQKRIDICRGCDRWHENSHRCLECGCQMRVKTSLQSSSCPLGKWDAHRAIRE